MKAQAQTREANSKACFTLQAVDKRLHATTDAELQETLLTTLEEQEPSTEARDPLLWSSTSTLAYAST